MRLQLPMTFVDPAPLSACKQALKHKSRLTALGACLYVLSGYPSTIDCDTAAFVCSTFSPSMTATFAVAAIRTSETWSKPTRLSEFSSADPCQYPSRCTPVSKHTKYALYLVSFNHSFQHIQHTEDLAISDLRTTSFVRAVDPVGDRQVCSP